MATSWDDHLNDTYDASYQVGPNYDAGYSSGGGGFGGAVYYPAEWRDVGAPGPAPSWAFDPVPMPGYTTPYPDTSVPMPGAEYWYDPPRYLPPRYEDGSYDTSSLPEY